MIRVRGTLKAGGNSINEQFTSGAVLDDSAGRFGGDVDLDSAKHSPADTTAGVGATWPAQWYSRSMDGVSIVVTVGGRTTRHSVGAGRTLTIGRTDAADIATGDPLASRRHASFHIGSGSGSGSGASNQVEIEDLGSRNGTIVLAPDPVGADTQTARSSRRQLEARVRHVIQLGAVVQIGAALVTVEAGTGEVQSVDDEEIVLEDPAMRQLYALADRVSASDLSVLILGESGVGKDVLARFIHKRSHRGENELLSINCGAISDSLLEAELFGYEKGAFTGAAKSTKGLLEAADRGSLFLDEVGELPPSFQVKLLRALEDQSFLRVGGRSKISVDVRFIAATNRNLLQRIGSGEFREDLYYRLNGISLTVPPLRERRTEILPLAEKFLGTGEPGARGVALSEAARNKLLSYHWPGNVRQLRNVVRRASVLATADIVEAEQIQLPTSEIPEGTPTAPAIAAALTPASMTMPSVGSPEALRALAEEAERQRIVDALTECAGNQTRAAKMLGITRRALGLRLIKYDIPRPRS